MKENTMPAKRQKTQPKAAKSAQPKASARRPSAEGGPHLYTLDVSIMTGPISKKFVKKNPRISRTIQIRGYHTLEDLHDAIFDAFDRFDPHMYEFQFGKGPMDPDGLRYVMPEAYESQGVLEEETPAGTVDKTTLDSLDLKQGRIFGYWFDFGDDWWHQIDVEAVEDTVPAGKYPKVTNRIGASPPQYEEEA
jgi:hypothetical protein